MLVGLRVPETVLIALRINVLDMSTSSPYWHTIFCDRICESDSRCATYRNLGTPVRSCQLADDVALHFIAHILSTNIAH